MNSSHLSDQKDGVDANPPITPVNHLIEIEYNKETSILLGKGAYGIVYRSKYEGKSVAVKRIERKDVNNDREIHAMDNLNHENVVKLISKQQDDDFLYLVMELCQGSVDDYIKGKLKRDITHLMPTESNALKQMACGLQYIHEQSFVHRDIKPANVLISAISGTATLKISGFGFSKSIAENSENFHVERNIKGTLCYMAPEYRKLMGKSSEGKEVFEHEVSIDIFSLGCLFFTYITKKHAFAEPSNSSNFYIVNNIIMKKKDLEGNGLKHEHYAYNIIDGMTQNDPGKRMKLKEVIDILAIASVNEEKVTNGVVEATIVLPPLDRVTYKRNSKILGEGSYGTVYKCIYNKKPFAIKRIVLNGLDQNQIKLEIDAMEILNHENVLKLIGKYEDKSYVYLVLELCQGTVDDYTSGKLENEIMLLMPSEPKALHQMTSGLQYIHDKLFVHRDIKPANVLIYLSKTVSPGSIIFKISDFGFTKPVTKSSKKFSARSNVKCTELYMAPEYSQLMNKTNEERKAIRVSVSIDVFSLGLLFFTYITKGKHPFVGKTNENYHVTIANIIKGKKNLKGNGLSKDHFAFQIIDGMTEIEPDKRWKLNQVFDDLQKQLQQQQ